jgi:serine phosphatase RsbU (regulator of sigma subunit)
MYKPRNISGIGFGLGDVTFQYFLEDLDEVWSEWTTEHKKDYTNLSAGNYQFHVRAKNVYGHQSTDAVYSFVVLPPWYKSWWAYGLYGAFTIMSFIVLTKYLNKRAHRKAHLQREISTAREMQTNLMPKTCPSVPRYQIECRCLPAHEVGGDHYDFFWLNDEKRVLGIALVDVEGKRMNGAFLSVLVNGMIKAAVESDKSKNLSELFETLNMLLKEKLEGKVSISLLLGKLDTNNNRFTYVNTGCPSPLLKQRDMITSIQPQSKDFRPALGIIDKKDLGDALDISELYKEHTCRLHSNDVLIAFSDGISEVKNDNNEFYVGRLKRILREIRPVSTAKEILEYILNDLNQFSKQSSREDDQTLLVIKKL